MSTEQTVTIASFCSLAHERGGSGRPANQEKGAMGPEAVTCFHLVQLLILSHKFCVSSLNQAIILEAELYLCVGAMVKVTPARPQNPTTFQKILTVHQGNADHKDYD